MEALKKVLVNVAWSSLIVSGLIVSGAMSALAQQTGQTEQSPAMFVANAGVPKSAELPDSPGVIAIAMQSAEPAMQQGIASPQEPGTVPSSTQSQAATQSQQGAPQKPVGTAAAEAPNSSGVAASEPAGIAIAPAKQRRARTIVLRVGAIIGAAVAVGVVVALTEATPSKPPGAH